MEQRKAISCIVVGVLFMLLSIPTCVQAAYEFYVTIEGTKQGKFKGESARKEIANKIAGISFQHEVKSPRDVASGQASVKRQHGPVIITKEWGASSPQLFQALVTNEQLKTVLFEFVRTNPNGQQYIYYTIKLTNAAVSSIRRYTGSGGAGAASGKASADTHELEDISFTYQKIEITSVDGKTMAMDEWRQ